jgi:predicted nuclease of predicted toxin-antitoxin system
MRILIDECLDWRLCRALSGHDCVSVQKLGWGGLTNGALLRKAEQDFDVFITGDRNLIFQQQLSNLDIAVCVLHTESTQLRHTLQLMPRVFGSSHHDKAW